MNNATLTVMLIPASVFVIVATAAMRRPRNAWVCYKCEPPYRVFLTPKAPRPSCPHHGPMTRQPNKPYRGSKV